MALLQVTKARERRQQALPLRLGVVDAGHQRFGDLVQRLASQPAADEVGQRLVAIIAARRDEQVHAHTQLAQRRDQRRQSERLELGGDNQEDAVGQRGRLALVEDVDLALAVVGAHQPVGQPQFLSQFCGPRLLSDERIGAALHDERLLAETIDVLGQDLAAPAAGLLQQ